jgi:hypothetical protein
VAHKVPPPHGYASWRTWWWAPQTKSKAPATNYKKDQSSSHKNACGHYDLCSIQTMHTGFVFVFYISGARMKRH